MEPSGIIGINMKKQNIEIKIGDIVEDKNGKRYVVMESTPTPGTFRCMGYDKAYYYISEKKLKKVKMDVRKKDSFLEKYDALIVKCIIIIVILIFAIWAESKDILLKFEEYTHLFRLEDSYSIEVGTLQVKTDYDKDIFVWFDSDVSFSTSDGIQISIDNIKVDNGLNIQTGHIYIYKSAFFKSHIYITDKYLGEEVRDSVFP